MIKETNSENKTVAPQPTPQPPVAKKKEIRELLMSDNFKQQVAMALPKHLTPERFMRTAITATMRTPKLLECTQESFFMALLSLSQYGLEPDGRRAHLIPFKKNSKDAKGNWTSCMEVQLIIDYKGLVELVRRSGDVSYIHADMVYSNDQFEFEYGTAARLVHKPAMTNRGERVCAYSFVRLKDGTEDFSVFSLDRVNAIRERSKSKDDGPWKTDFDEMAKKTAFRNHSKWLPFSADVRGAIELDDDNVETSPITSISTAIKAPSFLELPQTFEAEPETEPEHAEVA